MTRTLWLVKLNGFILQPIANPNHKFPMHRKRKFKVLVNSLYLLTASGMGTRTTAVEREGAVICTPSLRQVPILHSQLGGLVGVVGGRGKIMAMVHLQVVGLELMTDGLRGKDTNHLATRPHTHTRTHTYIHTHTYTHTYIHTYVHTYIHTRIPPHLYCSRLHAPDDGHRGVSEEHGRRRCVSFLIRCPQAYLHVCKYYRKSTKFHS